jgi:hypothetical protein
VWEDLFCNLTWGSRVKFELSSSVQIQEFRTSSNVLVGFMNDRIMEVKCKILNNIAIYSMTLSVTPNA